MEQDRRAAPSPDWPPIPLDERLEMEIRGIHMLIDRLRADHNALAARVAVLARSRGLTEEH